MNKQQEIQAWIKGGRHWHPGVSLMMKYSSNFTLKNYFSKCEPTNANQDSLLYELKKLAVAVDAPVVEPSAPVNQVATINPDSEIEKLDAEWKPKFKELAGLRQRLMFYGKDDEARKKAAFRILDLFDECKNIWRKRDYIVTHGAFPEIPEATKALPDDPVKLVLTRNNLRSRISKVLKRMVTYDDDKQIERAKDVECWRNEIQFIEDKLKQLGTT